MFVFKSMAEKSTRDRNKQIKKGLELLVTLFYKWTRKVEEGVTLGDMQMSLTLSHILIDSKSLFKQ